MCEGDNEPRSCPAGTDGACISLGSTQGGDGEGTADGGGGGSCELDDLSAHHLGGSDLESDGERMRCVDGGWPIRKAASLSE